MTRLVNQAKVTISTSLDAAWFSIEPVVAGAVGATSPARFVTVEDGTGRQMRMDVYAFGPDCFAFEEVVVWRRLVVVGFGSHVHAASLDDGSLVTIELGSYFGHVYPTAEYLLVASGERLLRMEDDRTVLWRSPPLGIDGVVVSEAGGETIRGHGEWDPPGGWRPFIISAIDGDRHVAP